MFSNESYVVDKLKEISSTYEYIKGKISNPKKIIPSLLMDFKVVERKNQYELYHDIAKYCKPLTPKGDIYIYSLNDEDSKKQIRNLIYGLKEVEPYKACFEGIVFVELPEEKMDIADKRLFFEFLDEQEWYTVFVCRGNCMNVYREIAKITFINYPMILEEKDFSDIKATRIINEKYEINFNKDKGKSIDNYIDTLKSKEIASEYSHIYIHEIAYNLIRNAVGGKNSKKFGTVSELIGGIDEEEFISRGNVKLGFQANIKERNR